MTEAAFTISQLARVCDKSRNTLTAWVASGRLSSIRQGGRSLIPMSEVLRVFPTLKAEELERALHTETDKLPRLAQRQADDDQTGRTIAQLRAQVEMLKMELEAAKLAVTTKEELVRMLTARVEDLTSDKRTLVHQLEVAEHQFDRLDRLIAMTSSSKKASPSSTQARDSHGRFAGTGKGVNSLFQQGDLTDQLQD